MINFGDIGPSLLKVLLQPRSSDFESRFTKGETLQGWVTKPLGPDSAIIRLRGVDMTASTPKPLVQGQSIMVKVEQLKPQLVVSLLSNDTPVQEKTAALLRMYLPSASPVSTVLGDLAKLFPYLSASVLKGSGLEKVLEDIQKAVKKPDGDSKNILQMIGLFHESELLNGAPTQNLKRSLLVVRQNIERLMEKDPKPYHGMLKKVNDALANIELGQLVNTSSGSEAKSWQIPYWNGEAMDTARLYVGKDGKENGRAKSRQALRLTLTLKMSRLGDVRAEAIAFKERLEGTVYAGTDAAVQAVANVLPELVKSLNSIGLTASFSAQRASKDFLTRRTGGETVLPVKNLLNLRA